MEAFHDYKALQDAIAQAREMLSDPDMAALAGEELRELLPKEEAQREVLRRFLIPRDPDDDRSVVMEIRPGAGGDEAALFAALLLRMYQRYAERKGFRFEPVDITDTELGGVKEAVFTLSGGGAFSRMKFESGVHRIQRVPVTEAGGRIHTSTATVAVLPEAGDVKVDNAKYKALFHTKAKMLSAEQVTEMIGHAVGGVCPFGVKEGVEVYLDESIKRFETVFPAAGSSNSAIEVTMEELEKFSGSAKWVDVSKAVN